MNNKIMYVLVMVFCILFPAVLMAGGGDGFMGCDWQEIRTVKGGAVECTISIDVEDMEYPDSQIFYNNKGMIEKYVAGYGVQSFIYNQAGKLTGIEYGYPDENDTFISNGKTVYTYDAKGKLVNIIYYDAAGTEYMREEGFTYENNGNIKIERLTPEGSCYKIDTYNKDMYLIEEVLYSGESVAPGTGEKKIESRTILKYDKDNNLLEREINNVTIVFEGMPKKIVQKFEYKFDNKGNKIMQTTKVTPADSLGYYGYLAIPKLKFTYKYAGDTSKQTKDTSKDKRDDVIGMKVQVEWDGSWYAATIVKHEGDKYLIHYDEYSDEWDEWVTKERIKFPK